MNADFLTWYLSGGTSTYSGSYTLPYFSPNGVTAPDGTAFMYYAMSDGHVSRAQLSSTGPAATLISTTVTWTTTATTMSLAAGVAATVTLAAMNAFVYAVTAGGLPTGLTLSPAGVISGSPVAGSYTFTVRAYGAVLTAYADQQFTWTVA